MRLAICMMIDDEMYGTMPSAKIPKRDNAPPEKRLKCREQAARLLVEEILQRDRVDARYRNIGTTAIDDQRADEKQDANSEFAQFARLLCDICRILWGFFAISSSRAKIAPITLLCCRQLSQSRRGHPW